MKVLVTGLFATASVSIVRRFGKLGCSITAADCHRMAFGMYSKYVSRRIFLPKLRDDPLAYAECLIQELESGNYDYYFPCFEEIILLSHFKDRVLAATKTIIPDLDVLITLHDKANLPELARSVGVDSPETFIPRSKKDVEEILSQIDYPVVIKLRQTSAASGLRRVENPRSIADKYFELVRINNLDENNLPIIQRSIKGPTICSLELCSQGEVLGQVMIKGLRFMPRTGGTSVFRESVSQPLCEQSSRKIIDYLGFSGFCGFDYILDEETNRPFLIDGNPRVTPSINLAYYAGCDMIPEWLRIADGKQPSILPCCEHGVRTKTHFADAVWLLQSYLAGFKRWSEEAKQRKQWWNDKDFHCDIRDPKDRGPSLMLYTYILSNLYRLVFTDFDSAQLFVFYNQYVEDHLMELKPPQ